MKTKALISFAVTAKLICVFVLAYAKIGFSHNEAHMVDDYHVMGLPFLDYLQSAFFALLCSSMAI